MSHQRLIDVPAVGALACQTARVSNDMCNPVFVKFNGPRFVKFFLYHAFNLLSGPFLIWIEGWNAARNMRLLALPVTGAGLVVWCVGHHEIMLQSLLFCFANISSVYC